MKKRKGMTLIEVVVAFIIMSFVGSMVAGVVTGTYALSAQLKKLPSVYYDAQGELEKDLKVLKEYAQAKRDSNDAERGENEEEKKYAQDQLTAKEKELTERLGEEVYNSVVKVGDFGKAVNLFGTPTELYRIRKDIVDTDKGVKFLLTGGVSTVGKYKRKAPIITNVTIGPRDTDSVFRTVYKFQRIKDKSITFLEAKKSESPTPENAGPTLAELGSRAKYREDLESYKYLYNEYFQWYMSTGEGHTAPFYNGNSPIYPDGTGKSDEYDMTILTSYPNGFAPIPGEDKPEINISGGKYDGKFLVCVVTPLSLDGTTGQPMASNPIYVSGLPNLQGGLYEAIIDPSMDKIMLDNNELWNSKMLEEGETTRFAKDIEGNIEPRPKERYVTGNSFTLSLRGENTYDRENDAEIPYTKSFSRYYEFAGGNPMTLTPSAGAFDIFAVVRSDEVNTLYNESGGWGKTELEFITSNDKNVKMSAISGNTEGSWRIIHCKTDGFHKTISIGNGKGGVAEFIVVRGIEQGNKEKIYDYLEKKYNIDADMIDADMMTPPQP